MTTDRRFGSTEYDALAAGDVDGANDTLGIWDKSAERFKRLTPNALATFLSSGGSPDVLVATDIGVTVQGYDAGLDYLDGLNFTNEATFKAGVNLEIGTDVQAWSTHLDAIAALSKTDGNIIVANGTTFVAENGVTALDSIKAPRVFSPDQYATVGAGSASDQAAFQSAVTAAVAVGGVVLIRKPSSTYRMDSGVSITGPVTILHESGVTYDMSNAPTGTTLFSAAGTVAAGVSLTGNAAKGDGSVSVASGAEAGFAAGDLVQVISDTVYDTDHSDAKYGEYQYVASTSDGVVTFVGKLVGGTYTTAASAQIRKVTPIRNVVTDFNGALVTGSATTTVIHTAVKLSYCVDSEVRGLRSKQLNSNAIWFVSCINTWAKKCRLTDALNSSTGYGVNFSDACLNCGHAECEFVGVRHASTTTTSSGDGYGVVRGLKRTFSTCYGTINTGDCWDTHANCEDVTDIGLVSYDCANAAHNYEGARATAIGCQDYRSAAYGVAMIVGAPVEPNEFRIVGHRSEGAPTGYPFYLAPTGGTVNNTTVAVCELDGCTGINSAGPALFAGNASADATTVEFWGVKIKGGFYSGASTNGSIYIAYDCHRAQVDNPTVNVGNVAHAGVQIRSNGCRVSLDFRSTVSSFANYVLVLHDANGTAVERIAASAPSATAAARVISFGGTTTATHIDESRIYATDFTIIRSLLARPTLRLYDHFVGDSLDARWNSRVGSDPQCVAAAIAANTLYGAFQMVTGDDAAASMAVNGVQLEHDINWRAADGGLRFAARLRINTVTDVALFFGFTDQVAALEMPFTLSGTTFTSNATDAVGFLFDTAADTDTIRMVGVANNVDATHQDSGVAFVNATFKSFEVRINASGVALFYIDDALVGTAMTGAVTTTIRLTPVVAAFSRGAASRTISCDFIDVEQLAPAA